MRTSKTIRDAVHGDISLSRDELRLIDTRPFQRLRGIKQLGMSSLVYPSATHTRFEHSLGTCLMADQIIQAIQTNADARLTQDEVRLIRAAALLHDITHVPFGHTFEDERRLFERHDRDRSRLERILAQGGLADELERQHLYHDVCDILLKTPKVFQNPWRYEIVAGTICADLLDYLRRDALFCGLKQTYDDRVFSLFIRTQGHLALDLQREGLFRHDALSELINLLRLRYNLTERVYYHHTKVAAGAMISKALELALEAGIFQYDELFELRDESFLYTLWMRSARHKPIRKLLEALECRALYKRVYLLTVGDFEVRLSEEQQHQFERQFHDNEENARTKVEAELCRSLRLPNGSCIIYCPSTGMALKEAHVNVKIDDTTVCSLDTLKHPEIEVLLKKHRSLWKFYVLMPPSASNRFEAAVHLCEEWFGLPNMLPKQSRGQLSFQFRKSGIEN